MAAQKTIRLKHSEVMHLLRLLEDNEREGWYFGNKDQYWERSEVIKAKLTIAANTKADKF